MCVLLCACVCVSMGTCLCAGVRLCVLLHARFCDFYSGLRTKHDIQEEGCDAYIYIHITMHGYVALPDIA